MSCPVCPAPGMPFTAPSDTLLLDSLSWEQPVSTSREARARREIASRINPLPSVRCNQTLHDRCGLWLALLQQVRTVLLRFLYRLLPSPLADFGMISVCEYLGDRPTA